MSVNTSDYYWKITRLFATKEAFQLSGGAYKLYICLNEIEAEANRNGDLHGIEPFRWFLCTDSQIREKTGMNIKTIQRAKKELRECGFIKVDRGHWSYRSTGKSDVKQPCMYTIMDFGKERTLPQKR